MAKTRYSDEWLTFQHTERLQISQALEDFLMDEGRYDCFTSLNYIVAELAGNADKANLKRAHFAVQGLNQADPAQYEKGMAGFKQAVSSEGPSLVKALTQRKAVLRVWFGRDEKNLVFTVFNNAPLLPIEAQRYREKIELARRYQTIQEVLGVELDQSEGGGLGLIITILMLRKLGLDEDQLTLTSDDQGTTATLVIPPQAEATVETLAEAAVAAIDRIPQFPDHVMQVLQILDDPTKSFVHISPIVRKDPNLLASLLKAANSSMYNLSRKVETIEEAVRILGLPAIQDLLLAVTAERLLINDFHVPAVKVLMEHAIEVAWYCRELTKAAKLSNLSGAIFLGAMLHDFGEIIVNSLVPGLTETLGALCLARGWNTFRTEVLTNGLNHSLAGAELARKWKFPDRIVEIIQYHHLPLEASRSSRDAVCVVSLGDFLWHRARNQISWDDLNPAVLEQFPQKSPEEWREAFQTILAKKKILKT